MFNPVSSSSSSPSFSGRPTVKVGNTEVECFDVKQQELTQEALRTKDGIAVFRLFAPHLSPIDPEKGDASTATIFTLAQGLAEALPGQHLTPFHDQQDLVTKVDPTGVWLERAGPEGRGETLAEFCTDVQATLLKMGMNPTPATEPTIISFKPENFTDQHKTVDLFSNVMSRLVDPPHGTLNMVIVNCDQALAINGATKQKFPLGELGGNFCIVGGYDKQKELVLLLDLDIAYPAEGTVPEKPSGIYWVPISDLVDAMNTRDNDAKSNRGYLAFSVKTS